MPAFESHKKKKEKRGFPLGKNAFPLIAFPSGEVYLPLLGRGTSINYENKDVQTDSANRDCPHIIIMIFFRCFFSFLLRFSFNLSFLYSRKTRPQLHGIRNSNCKRSSLPLHSTLNARPRATIFENLKQSQEETPTCVLTSPFRLYFGFHFYCLTTYHRNLNFILLIFFSSRKEEEDTETDFRVGKKERREENEALKQRNQRLPQGEGIFPFFLTNHAK